MFIINAFLVSRCTFQKRNYGEIEYMKFAFMWSMIPDDARIGLEIISSGRSGSGRIAVQLHASIGCNLHHVFCLCFS